MTKEREREGVGDGG